MYVGIVSILLHIVLPVSAMDTKKSLEMYLITRYYHEEIKVDEARYYGYGNCNKQGHGNNLMSNINTFPVGLIDRDKLNAALQKTEIIDISELNLPSQIKNQNDFDDVVRAATNFLQQELSMINRYYCNGNNEVSTSWKLSRLDNISLDSMISVKLKATGTYNYQDGSYPPSYEGAVTKKAEHVFLMPAHLYYQNKQIWSCTIS